LVSLMSSYNPEPDEKQTSNGHATNLNTTESRGETHSGNAQTHSRGGA
jgi:hypothetical protein